MSSVRSGSVVIKVKTGRSAPALLKYKNKIKFDEKGARETYLFESARNCSGNTNAAILEWEQTRQQHNTDKAMRKAKARHEPVDPATGLHESGLEATHVQHRDRSGRIRTRAAKPGEVATHARIEPEQEYVKSGEAVHSIYAFGADMVNPKDAEACQRAFEAVVAEREQNYKGLQEHIWAERNGASGLLHVHVASNATIARGFTAPDGTKYRAGQRMAGSLVHVHSVRDRSDKFLDEHQEYGFKQTLARVGSSEYSQAQRRSSQKDYWDHKRAHESNHDALRRLTHTTLASPDVTDRRSYLQELKREGIEVSLTPERDDYFYKLPGMRARVRGKNLKTDHASHEQIGEQLDAKSQGRQLVALRERQSIGKPAPLSSVTDAQMAALRPQVAAYASQEAQKYSSDQRELAQRWNLAPTVHEARSKALADVDSLPADALTEQSVEELLKQRLASGEDSRVQMELDERGRTVYSVEDPSNGRWVAIDGEHAGVGLTRDEVLRGLQERASERRRAFSQEQLAASNAALDAELERMHQRVDAERAQDGMSALHAAPEPEPWRSGLRDVRGNQTERTQQILDAVAQFEEDQAVDALARGERLDESQIPAGVGAGFLKKYGEHLDPAVREQLELREAKKQARSEAFEQGSTAATERKRLEERGGFDRAHEGHYDELWGTIQQSNTTRDRLGQELQAGVYEMDTSQAQQDQRAHEAWETKAERLREQDRQSHTDQGQAQAPEEAPASQSSGAEDMVHRVSELREQPKAADEKPLTPMQRKIRDRNRKSAAANKRREIEQSQNQSSGMSFGD